MVIEAVFSTGAMLVAAFVTGGSCNGDEPVALDVEMAKEVLKALLMQGKKHPAVLAALIGATRHCTERVAAAVETAARTPLATSDLLCKIVWPSLLVLQNPLAWTGGAELALRAMRALVAV